MTKETTIKRTYTIPLREKFANTPRHKRTNKAIRVLKAFLVRHLKSDNIKIGPKLNETLWENGIKNPPGKVKVNVTKDHEGIVRAELEGVEYVDFKAQEKKADPSSLKEKIEAKIDGGNKKTPVKKESKEDKKAKAQIKEDIKEIKKEVTKKESESKKVESESKNATVSADKKPVEKEAKKTSEVSKEESKENKI